MTTTELRLTHQLTRTQLVDVLATMTACRQLHVVHAVEEQPVDELVAAFEEHLARFGRDGRPTYPHREHREWAQQVVGMLEKALDACERSAAS